MLRNECLAASFLALTAGCASARPPPAPAPVHASSNTPLPIPAPAAESPPAAMGGQACAQAPTISPALAEALGRVHGLLGDPNDAAIRAAFSPTFFAAVPPAKVKALFLQLKTGLGPCTGDHPTSISDDTRAIVQIQCANGAINAALTVNPAPPHLLEGLVLKPASP